MTHATLWAAAVAALLAVSGCASGPGPQAAGPDQAYDPIEPVNRGIFAFNRAVDTVVLEPIAIAYDTVTPTTIRYVLRNVSDYLGSPVVLANNVFQGEWDRAEDTIARFFVNTTLGGLGLLDPATELGLPREPEDFGQTLAIHGVGEGPYLMLPLLGPSTGRDTIGSIVDSLMDPLAYLGGGSAPTTVAVARRSVSTAEFRAQSLDSLDRLEETSADFYTAIRSVYYQQRRGLILNGELTEDDLPDIGFDDTEEDDIAQ